MKKVVIHYFTGTGNTAHSVKIISAKLQAKGYDVDVRQVIKDVLPPEESYDYHIVAFPVLSWSAPVIMKRYLHMMPVSKGAGTAILAVNGTIFHKGNLIKGYTGQALEQVEGILKKKNYNVFLSANASFPDNWTQATNPPDKKDTEAIFPLGEAEVLCFAENFMDEKRELYRCGRFNRMWSGLIAALFGFIGRRALGKFYVADENCNGCSLCAKSCPVHAIKMSHKKPHWNFSCEDCNRCINICPERAIQVSGPLLIIQLIINTGLIIWAILAILKYVPLWLASETFGGLNTLLSSPGSALVLTAEIILILIATFFIHWLSFVPFDAFFRLLMWIPGVRRYFGRSYTKNYRRYMAPGFKP